MLGSLVLDLSAGDVECRAILLCVLLMSPTNNVYTTPSRTLDIILIDM